MKKSVYIFYIFYVFYIFSLFLFVSCTFQNKNNSDILNEEDNISLKVGDNLPISRALVAKMIALAFYDKLTINTMDTEINFDDISSDKWYYKYVNVVINEGFMSGFENKFLPENPLTLEDAQKILNKINKNNKIKIKLTDETKNMSISYALWCELYYKTLNNLLKSDKDKNLKDMFNILENNHIVLATSSNNSKLKNNYVITDKGLLVAEGISNDSYIDKEIKILEKEGEIIAILNINSNEPIIKNAYIVKSSNNNIVIFSGGVERSYKYNNSDNLKGNLCDIKIKDNDCLELYVHKDIKRGVIKRLTNDVIELDGEGCIELDKNFKVYFVEDCKVKWKQPKNLIVGTDLADFILKDNKVVGAVINEVPKPDKIRVAISSSNFKDLIHKEVTISATTNFKVIGDKETKKFNANEVVNFKKLDDMFKNNRLYIKADGDGAIVIKSIKRNYPNDESPKYRGTIELSYDKDGFIIVNELNLEQYLYSVVSSEMLPSYGVEASKVQAVVARSYVYNKFYENKYYEYGANIDDSVKNQVYNNIPENDISIQGVMETKGLGIVFQGKVVSANFFSTSAGITANSGEVWPNSITNIFPTSSEEYLKCKYNFKDDKKFDLSTEKNVSDFLKNKKIESYDSWSPWFRWDLEMTAEEIAASINENLKSRYEANPALIKTLNKDGTFKSKEIDSIGNLLNIEVLRRGMAGNIMEMKIEGTENTIIVMTEYNIRNLIRPKNYLKNGRDIKINRMDETYLLNYSIMPSSFYVIERVTNSDKNEICFKFYGGGNGHGVGLSQNGAKGMIDMGYNFKEVLLHYYDGVTIENIYRKNSY